MNTGTRSNNVLRSRFIKLSQAIAEWAGSIDDTLPNDQQLGASKHDLRPTLVRTFQVSPVRLSFIVAA